MPRKTTKPAKTTAPKTRRPAKRTAAVHPVKEPVTVSKPAVHVKRTYIFAVGRRKEAVARVRWHVKTEPSITVNERPIANYFPTPELQQLVRSPLVLTQHDQLGSVTAKVSGGGSQGQAEAVRLGIARALVKEDPDLRLVLKKAGYLRRDPRIKERKKYGLKRARRAPQWQKR